MSNNQVGTVYQQIIADVVESSRVDFEEGGVDEAVLEELKLGWQSKLSQLGVATFPWDPKPEPQAAIANPPTVPSNAGSYQAMNTPPINPSQNMPQLPNGPRIKSEPGLDSSHNISQPPPYANAPLPVLQGGNTAAARAAAHLQQNYGHRAAASINAIQSGGQPQPQQVQQNGGGGQPTMQQLQMMQQRAALAQASIQNQGMQQGQPRPQMTQEQYQRMMAQNAANRLAATQQAQNGHQNQNGQNGFPPQTDGPGDDDEGETFGVIKSGGETMGRIEIDSLIRAQIEARGRHMEGGGLMLPLKQASTAVSRKQRLNQARSQKQKQNQDRQVGNGQFDGGDEDEEDVKNEELDEDAINSDLDDPDEGLNDEEDEDEQLGHIMLCMYDKVQRVKNKWKCVMKDGVLTVNGREYVFHKASGEYEW